MDPESKQLLQESLQLGRDNNKMLHKLRRGQKWSNYTRLVYFIFIAGLVVVSYVFTKPYVQKFMGVYNQTTSNVNNLVNAFGGTKK